MLFLESSSVFYILSAKRETKQPFLPMKTSNVMFHTFVLRFRTTDLEKNSTPAVKMAPTRRARTSEKTSDFCVYFLVMHSRVSSTGPAHQTLHCDDITDFKSLFSSAAVGFQICLTSWMNTITFKQTTIGRAAEQLLLWTRPPRHSAPRLIGRTWTLSDRGFGCWLVMMTSETSFPSAHNVRTYWKASPHPQRVQNKQTPADTAPSVPEDVTGQTDVWASCRGAWRQNDARTATRF